MERYQVEVLRKDESKVNIFFQSDEICCLENWDSVVRMAKELVNKACKNTWKSFRIVPLGGN